MTDGFFEIGGEVAFDALARALGAALCEICSAPTIAVDAEATDEGAIKAALEEAWHSERPFRFLIRGLNDARPFEVLEPVFFVCHEAGATCRVIVDGPQGRQAAYAKAGGTMLWIAFLLTATGEVRYGPNSTHRALQDGVVPSVSDWVDAAQALGEDLPPVIPARA
ncbi:hypothetical protein GWK16_20835 [Roseomonas sp. JC162]|uniref:Uncharacterized protein n=1 Tax=Neoroseomonas marina TaxID=1232220 RepID=A0A848EI91_9PROT|nr:hypothetical protein [Neoroseomonas marina]NMJ43706.1 hypothetical protein [Neoroseomonas marina]